MRRLDAEVQASRAKKTKQAIDLQKEGAEEGPPKMLPKPLAKKEGNS